MGKAIWLAASLALASCAGGNAAQRDPTGAPRIDPQAKGMQYFVDNARQRGYLKAHRALADPQPLLGGPIHVEVHQSSGGVFVSVPDKRRLDRTVFGTPDHPQALFGSPVVTGVPPSMRRTFDGEYTASTRAGPFGDKHVTMPTGRLTVRMVDRTATDAATSNDEVTLDASWEDQEGNEYAVRCCSQVIAHGLESPTFGGVVTNHLLQGFSGIGTPLMPTTFGYAGFWGMGEVLKNGSVIDKPRLVHGMLTEYLRTPGHQLAFDEEVDPRRRQFHVVVAPVRPNADTGRYVSAPVNTGFALPNAGTLPFWHVTFETLETKAER